MNVRAGVKSEKVSSHFSESLINKYKNNMMYR